ncbi:MAG: biosynthetic-type acetolactate synthase large subunit [Acidaminococcaceae bacterium]|nr:biosynthetic-type acetolactate synthase large subunit [Acidaminococcaceae bacterium]
MKLNGAQVVIESLKKENVDVVFGYPGGVILPLYDEMYKAEYPRHILPGHEQGAVHAADGYARATGRPGVCFATSGPGVCNMVTGIATAYMDSIPLVVFSAQVSTKAIGRDSFQEADITGITTPITKHNYLVKKIQDLPRVIKEAFLIATTGRPGPVLVDIATDVFRAEIDFEYPEEVHLRGYKADFTGDESAVDRAVAAFKEAKKPVLMTGGGIISSNTAEFVRKIVEATGVPVVTTLMGKGAVSDFYDAHLGMVGMHGSYTSNMSITQCDLILAIGARFSDRVTGDVAKFAKYATVIQFEVDNVEIDKIIHADIPVTGDLRWSMPLFADKVLESAAELKKNFAPWREELLKVKAKHPFVSRKLKGKITPERLYKTILKHADKDAIVVTDVGQHQMWTAQFYDVDLPRHFLSSGGLGTMGFGLPGAMGAKVGCPDKQVILFTGDGSIMMCCQEFVTLHRYGIPVKVFLLHNNVLGMVNQWQRLFFGGRESQSIVKDLVDFPAMVKAMGLEGVKVTDPKKLNSVVKAALKSKGSVLVDVAIPNDENVFPMVPGGKHLDQMILQDTLD